MIRRTVASLTTAAALAVVLLGCSTQPAASPGSSLSVEASANATPPAISEPETPSDAISTDEATPVEPVD